MERLQSEAESAHGQVPAGPQGSSQALSSCHFACSRRKLDARHLRCVHTIRYAETEQPPGLQPGRCVGMTGHMGPLASVK